MAKNQTAEAEEPAAPTADELIARPTEPLIEAYQVAPGSHLPPGYRMTETGVAWLRHLSKLDLTQKSLAAMFGMSPSWLAKQIKEHENVRGAFELGQAEREAEYRAARSILEKVNPQVHIHVGKTKYGEVAVEQTEVKHTVHVVGARPVDEKELTFDEWQSQFAPKAVVEARKNAVDAESVDITPKPKTTEKTDV